MTAKRIWLNIILVAQGLVLLVGGITTAQEGGPPTGQEVPFGQDVPPQQAQEDGSQQLFVIPTQEADASNSISALGSVEANQVASLQFQTAGTVMGVYAEVGDMIQAGEVIADLNADDTWSSYNQAVLNLESANIAMNDLMQPASDDDIRIAQANIVSAQAAYSDAANSVTQEQIDNAQLKYDQALVQLAALNEARTHMSGTDEEITIQEAKIGAAGFDAEIARLQLEDLQTPDSASSWSASLRIKQAQLELEQLQEGPTQTEITSAQIAIERAQAAITDAQTELKQTQLIAPISGYVTAVNISAGQSISTGTVAIEISDLSTLRITVPVNELDIDQITEGMSATIQLDALTDLTIPGTVEHIGWISETSSDGIVTFDVEVALNTTDPRVRIGMTGEVTIETGSENS